MKNVVIDCRRGVRQRLEEAGFDAAQAHALVEVMTGQEDRLATKEDVRALRTDTGVLKEDVRALKTDTGVLKEDVAELKVGMAAVNGRIDGLVMVVEGLRQEVRERIDSLRQELTARFEALEARLGGRIDALEGRMDGLEGKMGGLEGKIDGMSGQLTMIKWLLGFVLASTVPIMLALVRLAFL